MLGGSLYFSSLDMSFAVMSRRGGSERQKRKLASQAIGTLAIAAKVAASGLKVKQVKEQDEQESEVKPSGSTDL